MCKDKLQLSFNTKTALFWLESSALNFPNPHNSLLQSVHITRKPLLT